MSTPLEDKLVTWIRAKAVAGGDLEMLSKVYSDPPREDLGEGSFPRAWVKEQESPSLKRGVGASQRIYDAHVTVTIYVTRHSLVTKGGSAYSNPEQAVSKIAYALVDELNTNFVSDLTQTSDPFVLVNCSYAGALQAFEFMVTYNVYKGEVHIRGRYIR